jgi:DNA-cytosine methyltransferase
MKVLSLFDGMSCGQIALNRLGIEVDTYYASEIDKYAMEITQKNFPETIQIGDVCAVRGEDYQDVDLILAGSPCQGFSFAGKQLAFDDPRSALFFEFIRLLKEIKPKYFLLENVKMKKEYLQIISEQVSACYPEIPFGIEPIFINSSLVSAQSRQRYYWTNIPNITQPEERGIVLRDILEGNPEDPTLMSDKFVARNGHRRCMIDESKEKASNLSAMEYVKNGRQGNYLACDKDGVPKKVFDENLDKMTTKDGKAFCLTVSYPFAEAKNSIERKQRTMIPTSDKPKHIGTATDLNGHDILKRVYSPDGKSPTVNTCQGGNREPKVVAGAWRGRSLDESGKNVKWKETKPKQMLETRKDEKSNAVSTFTKDNVVVNTKVDLTRDDTQEVYWRKLTPLECERLQTVPDNYTEGVSNTQRYKMLGNGWTVEVICHILKNMEV